MKYFFTITSLVFLSVFAYAQENENDDKPRSKRPYTLENFHFGFAGSLYNYHSTYLDHIRDLSIITAPSWSEIDSVISHDNRQDFNLGLNFQKQLFSNQSYFYGNLSTGFSISTGGRIKASYMYDYFSHNDTAFIGSEQVTNLDTIINLQHQYVYRSTDFGLNIAYTISSPPKYTFVGEVGVGISGMVSLASNMDFIDTESMRIRYLDEYSRQEVLNTLSTDKTKISAKNQSILRAYIPIKISYKINNKARFAISTYFNGGIEFQMPKKGNIYSYPYLSIGIGFRYFL